MAKLEARMMGRSLRREIENDAASEQVRDDVNKKYFGFSDMSSPRYAAGDRGQQAVDIAERMRVAAKLSEIEDDIMRSTQPAKEYETQPGFVGPKYTGQPQAFTGGLYDAAMKTVDFEARKDKQGNVDIYRLPSGDMGGSYEVAGINDRYHPGEARRLAGLPPEQREIEAAKYIRKYTAPIVDKMPDEMKAFVQDMAFNRGAGGATKYIQQGLNDLGVRVAVDGKLGPKTLQAIQGVQPRSLMQAASNAQLQDEYEKAQSNPARRKFLQGLENRIRNRFSLFGMAG